MFLKSGSSQIKETAQEYVIISENTSLVHSYDENPKESSLP
jgi:hypothetical protein